MNSTHIYASSINQLNAQNSEIDLKIHQTNDEIGEVSSELSSEMKEVQNLIYQIGTYEDSILDLSNKIGECESKLSTKQKEIENKQKELEEKKDLLNRRLVAVYESGSTSYLDMLLSSASLSDFISRYYFIEKIAECDANLIQTINQTKVQLETDKKEIEENKVDLENSKTELETKKQTLATLKQQKDKNVANLTAEEKRLKDELEDFQNEKRIIDQELEAIDRQAKNSNIDNSNNTAKSLENNQEKESNFNNDEYNSNVSKSSKFIEEENENLKYSNSNVSNETNSLGYIFPVAGCSKANINNLSYPSYPGHTGIDINKNVIGKSVVAVKDGVVEISKATSGSIPNYGTNGIFVGSYTAYGEVVVINHNDGTRTLYAHMKFGSRTVKVGDKVKQGQVIGVVGNTGNVSPRPTSSNPLEGTHLHFEIRKGGGSQKNCVNPISYLP